MIVALAVLIAAAAADETPASASAAPGVSSVTDSVSSVTGSVLALPFDESPDKYKGYVVVIDAGHQRRGDNRKEPIGPGSKIKKAKVTGGTRGVATKVPEYKLTLTLANLLKKRLEAKGVKVVMTRTRHDVNISNIQRAKTGNKAKATLVVRIHADGNNNRSVKGISTLYPGKNRWTGKIRWKSKRAADIVQKELVKTCKRKNRGIKARSDITGFNWSTVPVILPEVGFLSNRQEDKVLNTKAEQRRIAEALTNGILAYLETQPKPAG